MKVKELLARPKAWTQRAFARDKDGKAVLWNTPSACQFCLIGAVRFCYPDMHEQDLVLSKLKEAIKRHEVIEESFMGVSGYNDCPGTTHADILAVATLADV